MTSVLVICTANICRSPVAEAFLRDGAARRGVDAEITSAGVEATVGRRVAEGSRKALAPWGLDLDDHRARRSTPEVLEAADLVLTMEVDHLARLVASSPATFRHSFTLRELVELGARHGACDRDLTAWLATIGHGRSPTSLLPRKDLDVADPYGGPVAGYQRCADDLATLCFEVATLLWGPVPR